MTMTVEIIQTSLTTALPAPVALASSSVTTLGAVYLSHGNVMATKIVGTARMSHPMSVVSNKTGCCVPESWKCDGDEDGSNEPPHKALCTRVMEMYPPVLPC